MLQYHNHCTLRGYDTSHPEKFSKYRLLYPAYRHMQSVKDMYDIFIFYVKRTNDIKNIYIIQGDSGGVTAI
jgi:hypothetical protein